LKLTLPLGLAPLTVAVRVMLCPTVAVLALLARLVLLAVAAWAGAIGASSEALHSQATKALPMRPPGVVVVVLNCSLP
jgi:hypothetical protein